MRPRRELANASAFMMAALLAALAPWLFPPGTAAHRLAAGFPGWPTHYEGRILVPMPLSAREQGFSAGFPGQIGRFSDGRREIILRWVAEPTRALHPAADCLRGVGYTITPMPVVRDDSGAPMSCLRATRAGSALSVCEQVRDTKGVTWPDVSAWYWSTIMSTDAGPWWSTVVATPN